VPEERKVSGLDPDSYHRHDCMARAPLDGPWSSAAERLHRRGAHGDDEAASSSRGPEQKVSALSGGNQQFLKLSSSAVARLLNEFVCRTI
jgi:ABC-type sugar transport system ATPase subunit